MVKRIVCCGGTLQAAAQGEQQRRPTLLWRSADGGGGRQWSQLETGRAHKLGAAARRSGRLRALAKLVANGAAT